MSGCNVSDNAHVRALTLLVCQQIRDAHVYAPRLDNTTGLFNSWATDGRASVVGEFGGYGLNVTDHMLLPLEVPPPKTCLLICTCHFVRHMYCIKIIKCVRLKQKTLISTSRDAFPATCWHVACLRKIRA